MILKNSNFAYSIPYVINPKDRIWLTDMSDYQSDTIFDVILATVKAKGNYCIIGLYITIIEYKHMPFKHISVHDTMRCFYKTII